MSNQGKSREKERVVKRSGQIREVLSFVLFYSEQLLPPYPIAHPVESEPVLTNFYWGGGANGKGIQYRVSVEQHPFP